MKSIALLFFCFIFNDSSAQITTNVMWTQQSSMPADEVIYYNPGKDLVWDNFTGKAIEGGNVAAMTVSGFGYKADIKSSGGKGQLNISVYCYFNKNKSWVKPAKTTTYILTHEQHHFDISYIAASIFIDKLQSSLFTNGNFNVLLPRIYNECCDIMNKMQDDYDGQTKNGQLKDIQVKWNNIIDEKINFITR
jgi:hypothetical protein